MLLFAISLFMILGTGICVAQTDLSTVDRFTVKVAGNEETVTVLQDYSNKTQWYYVPNRPRLVERKLRGRMTPVFNLIRYQFRKGSSFDEGGIMQFALSLALPGDAVNQVKTKIAARMTAALRDEPEDKRKIYKSLDISLSALPIKNAQFFLYTPGGGKMMASDTPTEGMAPTFASQNIPFSLTLTENGASVFDTITNDTLGGVPVIIRMDYSGLTAPAGFKCTVNWDNTYRSFKADVKLSAALAGIPYVTPKIGADYSNLRVKLEKRGCIKLEVIEGSDFKLADADKYLQPILTLLATEMLEAPAAPVSVPKIPKTDPLKSIVDKIAPIATTAAGLATGGAGVAVTAMVKVDLNVSLKDVKKVRTGTQTFNMNVRQVMTQSTMCGGFIGIAEYPQSVKDQIVTVVPAGDWDKAYLSLPRIISDDAINIREVTLTAGLNDGKKNYDQQVATWTPEEGWTGLGDVGQDEEIRRFAFATMALKAAMPKKWQDAYFKLDSKISYKPPLLRRPLTYRGTTSVKLFSGNAPMSSPLDMAELWLFDAGYLYFNEDDPDFELKRVKISITSPIRVTVTIDPARNYDDRMIPIFVDKDAASIKANIVFTTISGKPIQWEHNGKNLKEIPDYAGGVVELNDWEWMR